MVRQRHLFEASDLRVVSPEHHAGGDTCIIRDVVHILSVGTLWGPKQQHNTKTSFNTFMSLFEVHVFEFILAENAPEIKNMPSCSTCNLSTFLALVTFL